MVKRKTRNELIKLRKEVESLRKSKKVLEERQKRLTATLAVVKNDIRENVQRHNALLKTMGEACMEIAKRFSYCTLENLEHGSAWVEMGEGEFMGKKYDVALGASVGSVPPGFEEISDMLRRVIESGAALDENVKKAVLLNSEIKRNGRKMAYLENVLIPEVEGRIADIEESLDERSREELSNIKRFGGAE